MSGCLEMVAAAGPALVARATVVLVVAAALAAVLRSSSAAERHLVWAWALAAVLALPAIHRAIPAWPILPAVGTGDGSARPAADGPIAIPADAVVAAAAGPGGAPPAAGAAGADRSFTPGQAVAALWLAGALVCAARLAAAFLGVRRLAREAAPATGRPATLLEELAHQSGIRGRVRALLTRTPVVPMAWGWRRPVVLLPEGAGSWPEERLRVVLLHELAHVRRGDVATQLVGELARGVLWFHPLAWWGLHRLRAEQEAACDDCVLRAGTHADDYAEDLLAVTGRLAGGPQATGVALAMGRPGRIEARIRAILAPDRDRRPVGAGRAAAVGACFAALATLAAVVGPAVARDDTPDDPPVAGLLGEWFDAAADAPGDPLEIGKDDDGLWLALAGSKARLEPVADDADVEGARRSIAVAVITDGEAERRLQIERKPLGLSVEISTRFTDGSGRPDERRKTAYARRDDFLPNGYYLFFANTAEAGLAKEGVNFGAIIAGPHVPELGNSGAVIYGRIVPNPDAPPHPDHAPGFFVIDSATDAVKTGLDREAWLAELEARHVTAPKLVPSQQKWPKRW